VVMAYPWIRRLFGMSSATAELATVKLAQLAASTSPPATRYTPHDGEKYPGGYGPTDILFTDYWTLRARSAELFKRNLYARGLIRRLVTNEINTGLHLEAVPEEKLLGKDEDSLADWSEDTENRFELWGENAPLCDHAERSTFGELQATARAEALIEGDVLVVLIQDPLRSLPRVQLICGSAVQSPLSAGTVGALKQGNRIVHGVEIDPNGKHVAYWVSRKDPASPLSSGSTRISAFGEKTNRRQAWLMYGTDKRMDDVRGEPILALVAQSIKEIDRYRDSAQRKAVINAMLAMFIKKSQDKVGTRPIAGGAVRRGTDTAIDSTGTERRFNVAEYAPGVVLDELQQGEEPEGFLPHGTDEKFGDFEEAIVQAIAWANEVPPEILRLSFSSNYSASQAAINEFKIYLNKVRYKFGGSFCQPIYVEWLISEALLKKITVPGLLEAWRDPTRYDEFYAWVSADWTGHIKPAVDLSKLVGGYSAMVNAGFITRDRASRELTGTKYSKNVQKLTRENELLAKALEPIALIKLPKPSSKPSSKPN
jgi:lambda family phage portal protein